MANSAMVDDKDEIAVKSVADNSNSHRSLVEKEKNNKQTPGLPAVSLDWNQSTEFDEKVLLLEIQRQLAERDHYLRAKDIQLQETEARLLLLVQSGSYRLGRTLTWPLRIIKRLFR